MRGSGGRDREDGAERSESRLGRCGQSSHTQLDNAPDLLGATGRALLEPAALPGLASSQLPPYHPPPPSSTLAITPPCSLQVHPSPSSSLRRPPQGLRKAGAEPVCTHARV